MRAPWILTIAALLGSTHPLEAQLSAPCVAAFEPGEGMATAMGPSLTATGDFDDDGHLDIVSTPNPGQSYYLLFFGDGTGGFEEVIVPTPYIPRFPHVADLDADGDLDLVFGGTAGMRVLLGDGTGDFDLEYVAGFFSGRFTTTADLDGDDNLDILVLRGATIGVTTELRVFLGDGSGDFVPLAPIPLGTNCLGLALADFDDDSLLDVVVTSLDENNLYVLLGDGAGSFDLLSILPVTVAPVDVITRDLDSNGTIDLIVSHTGSSVVSTRSGNGDGTFDAAELYETGLAGTSFMTAADFNEDGLLDVVTSPAFLDDEISVLLGAGGLGFQSPLVIPIFPTAQFPSHGDFDEDGHIDVMVPGHNAAVLTILFNRTFELPDCNGNGVADPCDVSSGTSPDANSNLVPDECEVPYLRGDSNTDGQIGLQDPIFDLEYLFAAGPSFCLAGQDVNASGDVDVSDPIYNVLFQFAGGPPPPAPFPGCGLGPATNTLSCETVLACP